MATTNPIDWEVKYKELAAKTDEYIKKNEATKLERAVVSLVEKLLGIEHVKLESHMNDISSPQLIVGIIYSGAIFWLGIEGAIGTADAQKLDRQSASMAALGTLAGARLDYMLGLFKNWWNCVLKGQLKQLKKDIAEKEQRDKEEKEREENEEKDRVELEREDFENRVALLSKEEEVVTLLGQVYRDNQPVRAQINCNLPLLPLPHTLLPDHGQTISTSASQDLNVIKMRK
ncbi:hypothetical protein HK104_000322 [Borealophlyctis nickersoniae]|nr:hypothetical protein HK104_000322 [Borealophlyctis nickersoniae]